MGTMQTNTFIQADCLEWMREQPDDSVDLVCCSSPYEAQRTYGIEFKLKDQAWVDWSFPRFIECVRICKGLVVWVVEGKTRQFRYSCTPFLLMADLHRAGVRLRKPAVFHRNGIFGSGGPDWLRNDWEPCICASKGRLPWSCNKAMGHKPKWAPGGAPSYRMPNGRRVAKLHTKGEANGKRVQGYNPPEIANPGNVIRCDVGGGRMGSELAHDNEAPYPEKLCEFFIRSFCPPGGIVLDIFSGSGTTAAVAYRTGRQYIGVDIRESQVALGRKRLGTVQRELIA